MHTRPHAGSHHCYLGLRRDGRAAVDRDRDGRRGGGQRLGALLEHHLPPAISLLHRVHKLLARDRAASVDVHLLEDSFQRRFPLVTPQSSEAIDQS